MTHEQRIRGVLAPVVTPFTKDLAPDPQRFFSETVERVGDARLRIYLYHIPSVAMGGISPDLVERLLARYPGVIAGMKDSSGDWTNTKTMLDNFATSGFDLFVGSETFLLANMQHGGVGCISATANVNPAAIDRLFRCWQEADAGEQQQRLDAVRAVVNRAAMLPALKAVLAHYRNDPAWVTVRPPLVELAAAQLQALSQGLDALGFTFPLT